MIPSEVVRDEEGVGAFVQTGSALLGAEGEVASYSGKFEHEAIGETEGWFCSELDDRCSNGLALIVARDQTDQNVGINGSHIVCGRGRGFRISGRSMFLAWEFLIRIAPCGSLRNLPS